MEFLRIVRNAGLSLHFYKNIKFKKGKNLEKKTKKTKKDFNISLILSLKCMQSRPAGVSGVEGPPSLDESADGQLVLE